MFDCLLQIIVKSDATGLIMSLEEFDKFNKSVIFKLDSKLYIDNEDYRNLMEVITSPSAWNKKKQFGFRPQKTKNSSRDKIHDDAKNLILGSSKPTRIRTETILKDTIVDF